MLRFIISTNKKMGSAGNKSSLAKEEKRNLVLRFCISLKVSPVNIDDQMQLFPAYTSCFLLQYGYYMDFSLHLNLNLLE